MNTVSNPEETLLELGEVCVLHEKNYNLCFNKEGYLMLKGKMEDNVRLELNTKDGNKINCIVSNDYLKLRTVCKDEFGNFITKSDFEINFLINNLLVTTVTRNEIKGILLGGYITDPKIMGKRAIKFVKKNPQLVAIPLVFYLFKEEIQ